MELDENKDYSITKLEKGPLQRFKNQNLLLKKYGEMGLQIYKVITGKRTAQQLRKDLDIESDTFFEILGYMQEAGMVELAVVVGEERPPEKAAEKPEKKAKKEEVELPAPEIPEEEREEEITPIEEIKPVGLEEEEKPQEEVAEETLEKEEKPEEEAVAIEEEQKEEEIDLTKLAPEEEVKQVEEELSPVEKIIKDKYGSVGIEVYKLIDGQRTAEEIMKQTGLTESKLVEILDFMDEQGIIKLEYPKERKRAEQKPEVTPREELREEFTPMIEEEGGAEEIRKMENPVDIPIKASLDIVKSVQLKAKVLLKFGEKGAKVLDEINGKNDTIDIALKTGIALFELYDILRFMLQNDGVVINPMNRNDVKKKYGDDGFSVYKKYGREGLMLYELIGKDMSIKQMADKVTRDKLKVVEMFIYIHNVLGIDLPIDKDVLARQLG